MIGMEIYIPVHSFQAGGERLLFKSLKKLFHKEPQSRFAKTTDEKLTEKNGFFLEKNPF